MLRRSNISYPPVEAGLQDYSSIIESHIVDSIKDKYKDSYNVIKYYKTDNAEIYDDFVNKISIGIPFLGVRCPEETTDEFSLMEDSNLIEVSVEILIAISNTVSKDLYPKTRYANIVKTNVLNILRKNRVKLNKNQAMPIKFLSYRVLFNNSELDLSLLTVSTKYFSV